MKIVVIGTVNRDTIIEPRGEARESFGGLLYTLLTLALCTEEGTQIVPVFNLGQDAAQRVLAFLTPYPQVSLDGIQIVPEMNNHAILTYRPHGDRIEVLDGGVPAIEFRQIVPFLPADILLVNFISGKDLSLDAMMQLRSSTQATIYADIHSLTLGIDSRGRRYWRQFPQWPSWTSQMNVVQVNRGEARLLSQSIMEADADFISFGEQVLETGPSMLLITLGAEGSAMVTSFGGHVCLDRFVTHASHRVRDTTGCGDIFLAAFVAENARSGDPHRASQFANQMAGARCALGGLEELSQLDRLGTGRVKKC